MAKKDVLLPFLLKHAVIGGIGACGTVLLMVWADFANLRTLVMASDVGFLALGVMTVFFVITFSSVQMGFALMFAADRDNDDGGNAGEANAASPLLSRVLARLARANAAQPAPARATSSKPVLRSVRF